jgi:hypothetical protein
VTIPSRTGRERRLGIVVHRSATLMPDATTRRNGIPLTRPDRTLLDLRRVLTPAELQTTIRKALDLRLAVPPVLLDDFALTRSDLERRFLRLCRRHHLPSPEVNAVSALARWTFCGATRN